MNFSANGSKKCLVSWKSTKNHRFGQTLQLFEQTTMFWHFEELFRKKIQKVARFVKKHEHSSIWPKLATSRRNYHVFAFRSTFREKVAKSASFRETARKIIDLAKALQLLEQATMSFSFWWTFKKKVAKSASSREKAPKIIDFLKLQLSEKTTMFWRFDEHCSKKLQKAARAVKKHEKSSIWPKLATFRTNYHVLAFRWTFQEKNAKSGPFREKARTLIDLAKTLQLLEETTMFWHFDDYCRRNLQKGGKSGSFREKWRKIIDLAKTFNFSSKLPCLSIFMNFSARSCKKLFIPWKSTRNHRFGQNLQLFEQTTMFWHFDQLFGKKLQKVPHFVKQHEKSLIWPKLCNFWNKLQCLFPFDELSRKKLQKVRRLVKKHQKSSIFSTCNFPRKLPCFDVSMNIAAKCCKKLLVPWKSTKNHQFGQIFATFRTNFDVFAFRWIFKEKVAKSASFREKARKIIDLAKTLQLFEQTTMFWHFDEVVSRKLQKVPHFVKNHEKSSIWRKLATFPTNYHVLTLWWTFQRKVAESTSFSEKTLKIIDWAKTCNFF